MITPPEGTPVFYTVLFERPAAQYLTALLAPTAGGDIDQVIVTSLDMTSDIEALHELHAAVATVAGNSGEMYEKFVSFNPIYLPMKPGDLATKLDIDKDGDLLSIDGLATPFISSDIKISTEQFPTLADGKICFKQFALPTYHEIVERKVLLS